MSWHPPGRRTEAAWARPLEHLTRSCCLPAVFALSLVPSVVGAAGSPPLLAVPQSVLALAQREEGRVASGRVVLQKTLQNKRLSDGQIMRLIRDPKAREVESGIAQAEHARVDSSERIVFDNRANRLLTRETGDGQNRESRALFTQTFLRCYNRLTSPADKVSPEIRGRESDEQVFTLKPSWPPYWPYDLLQGRFWTTQAGAAAKGELSLRLVRHVGPAGPTTVLLMKGADGLRKVWIDTARGYAVPRIQYFDQNSHLRDGITIDYQHLPGGLWYPEKLVDSFFAWADDGSDFHFLSRIQTTWVRQASLNVPIEGAELEFGDIPHGVLVEDYRFKPPLAFTQGQKQLTDRELFQLARNRGLLADPTWSGNAPPASSWALAIGGVLLTVSRGGRFGRQSVAELDHPASLESAVIGGKFGPGAVALAGEFGRSAWASHDADAWAAAKLTRAVRVQTFRLVTQAVALQSQAVRVRKVALLFRGFGLSLGRGNDGVGFDLDEQLGRDEAAHLDYAGRGTDIGEQLAVGSADFFTRRRHW